MRSLIYPHIAEINESVLSFHTREKKTAKPWNIETGLKEKGHEKEESG